MGKIAGDFGSSGQRLAPDRNGDGAILTLNAEL